MQYGYSAVSVSMIVEASGVTKPTLYHYFQDKEALYTQVLIRMMNRATEFIQPVVESDDSLRNKLVSLFTGFFANSPTTLTALLRDFAENIHNQPVQAVMTAYMTAIVEPFEAIFRQSLPSETSPDKVRMMAQMVISLLDAFTLQIRMEHGRCFDYQAKAEEAVDILMEGFAKTLTN
jgi:AcrR family transcriptional regulator